jgi:hypothetical protein
MAVPYYPSALNAESNAVFAGANPAFGKLCILTPGILLLSIIPLIL